MKFSAPHKVGVYTYSVILKSDSYIDLDQSQNIKVSSSQQPTQNIVLIEKELFKNIQTIGEILKGYCTDIVTLKKGVPVDQM